MNATHPSFKQNSPCQTASMPPPLPNQASLPDPFTVTKNVVEKQMALIHFGGGREHKKSFIFNLLKEILVIEAFCCAIG
jgi:hypothetical protein